MAHNIRLLFQNQAFQPEVVKAMGEAYDLASEITPDGVDPEMLARAIITAARTGELDPMRLCDAALYHLRHMRERPA